MFRKAWKALLLVAVASVPLFTVPPAQAASSFDITFTAEAWFGCGFALAGTQPVTLPGPTCSFSLSSQLCMAEEVTLKKVPPASAGWCTFVGGGVMTGYCGLSTGSGTAFVTTTSILGSTTETLRIDFAWNELGSLATVAGTAFKLSTGQQGPFFAAMDLVGPTFVFQPSGGSCLAANAWQFTLIGHGSAALT